MIPNATNTCLTCKVEGPAIFSLIYKSIDAIIYKYPIHQVQKLLRLLVFERSQGNLPIKILLIFVF